MELIYPDLEWYSAESERKNLLGRCPHASVHRCPRYFASTALLSDVCITTSMPVELYNSVQAKWQQHELSPATAENDTSISGGAIPNCYSNFCPEVAFDTFQLFCKTLIRIVDDIDREYAMNTIVKHPAPEGKDWRYSWSHIEPLHFSNCSLYAKLYQEKSMSNITFNGPVTGNINVAGHSISAQAMSLSLGDLIAKIDAAEIESSQKEAAKSKVGELLAHPVVAAIIGAAAGQVFR